MKARNLFAIALGLFIALSYAGNASAMPCAKCKAEIPLTTKPVVSMAQADMKCGNCGGTIVANSAVSRVVCPACKAEMDLCANCLAKMGTDTANAANADAQAQVQNALQGVPK
jgi:DNA-directed RNA polymerase subunit RPC12/RpoP